MQFPLSVFGQLKIRMSGNENFTRPFGANPRKRDVLQFVSISASCRHPFLESSPRKPCRDVFNFITCEMPPREFFSEPPTERKEVKGANARRAFFNHASQRFSEQSEKLLILVGYVETVSHSDQSREGRTLIFIQRIREKGWANTDRKIWWSNLSGL